MADRAHAPLFEVERGTVVEFLARLAFSAIALVFLSLCFLGGFRFGRQLCIGLHAGLLSMNGGDRR